MTACPCDSGRALEKCCGPYLDGAAAAPTAEALMRSRYSAYALRKFAYLGETLAPEARGEYDAAEAERSADSVQWRGLEIRNASEDTQTGLATVEFIAKFRAAKQDQIHHERASFRRENGKWLYVDGVIDPKAPPRNIAKVGRNDPCPCGSGKKYKKCHGA